MHGSLLDTLEFNQVDHYNLPRVKQFYKANGMRAQAPKGDLIFIASIKQQIVAAVRLNPVNSCYLLRSMCVSAELRQHGIGTALLIELQTTLRELECYCFPFSHLQTFYGHAGFLSCDSESVPDAIKDRYTRYINNGKDICLMKHQPEGMLK